MNNMKLEELGKFYNCLSSMPKHIAINVNPEKLNEKVRFDRVCSFFDAYTYEKLIAELNVEEITAIDFDGYDYMTFVIDGEEVKFQTPIRINFLETLSEINKDIVAYKTIKKLAQKIEEIDGFKVDVNSCSLKFKEAVNDDYILEFYALSACIEAVEVNVSTFHRHKDNSFICRFSIPTDDILSKGTSIRDRAKVIVSAIQPGLGTEG